METNKIFANNLEDGVDYTIFQEMPKPTVFMVVFQRQKEGSMINFVRA